MNSSMFRKSAIFAAATLASTAIMANTWYIGGASADDSNPGTAEAPFATPAAAFAAGGSGDTFLFAPGNYSCAIANDFDNLTLRGTSGDPADVTLDAGGAYAAISVAGMGTTLDSLTFTGGETAGAILFSTGANRSACETAAHITNCIFANNKYGLVYSNCVGNVAENCDFIGNTKSGALFFQRYESWYGPNMPGDTWTDCRFLRNDCGTMSYDVFAGNDRNGPSANQRFYRCIFAHNTNWAAYLVADHTGIGVVHDHCTFFDNRAGVFYGHYEGGTITNSIIVGTSFTPSQWRQAGSVNDVIATSLMRANGPIKWQKQGTGPDDFGSAILIDNFDGEPSFVDPFNDDFRLYADSDALLAANLCEDGSVVGAYPNASDAVALPAPTDWYVDVENGDDSWLGQSADAPFQTIAKALSLATPGSTIHVAAGSYPATAIENHSGSATMPIRIVCEPGAKITGADGNGLTLGNVSHVTVEGFDISGSSNYGISIVNGYGWTITNCLVTANGSIGINTSVAYDGMISGCLVATNTSHGVNLGCATGNMIYRSHIDNNGKSHWKYGVHANAFGDTRTGYSCCNEVKESSVSGNYSAGIAMGRDRGECGDGLILANKVNSCVVNGNGFYGICAATRHYLFVTNTIVANNGNTAFQSGGNCTILADYCGIYGNGEVHNDAASVKIGEHCVTSDPKFVDAPTHDYHLWDGSECIDAGYGAPGIDIGMFPEGPTEAIEAGGNYYVKPDGDDSADGKSWDTAFATVAHAASVASYGSVISIAAGSYNGTVTISSGATGMDGEPVKYIACDGRVEIVSNNGPALSLSAATWNEFYGIDFVSLDDSGVSLVQGGDLLFSNCTFSACAQYGLYAENNPRVTCIDCDASHNGSYGIYIRKANDSIFTRCTMVGNGGAGFRAGENRNNPSTGVQLHYCLSSRNGGYGIDTSGDNCKYWTVDHCTILGNNGCAFGYNGGGHWSDDIVISNSIVAFNAGGSIYISNCRQIIGGNIFHANASAPIFDGNGGQFSIDSDKGGNLELNPAFCNWFANEDGALYADSPAIGTAPGGGNYGCYQGPGIALPSATTYYVRPDGNDGNDGLADTAEGAFATISAASAVATNAGDTVHIAEGIYAGPVVVSNAFASATAPIRYIGEEGVVITAPAGGYAVIVDQVEGIDFSDFAATYVGNPDYLKSRAGILLRDTYDCCFTSIVCSNNEYGVEATYHVVNDSFKRSTFTGNRYEGLELNGTPYLLVDRCIATGNGRYGIYSNGQWHGTPAGLTVRQSLVFGNGSDGFHSGNFGCFNIENCLVAGNASTGIAFEDNARPSSIRNTIIYGNTNYGLFISGGGNTLTADHCCFYENVQGDVGYNRQEIDASEGSVFDDPRFTDYASGKYRLLDGSPCVNAGVNLDWMADETDYDGRAMRIARKTVDIGPYEVSVEGLLLMLR